MASKASIVLADDDDDLRAVYATWLRQLGHEVAEASDGNRAVELVLQRRPDLLILDLWMPGLDGLQVLDRLRHDPAGGRLKVVMFSVQGDADARLESFGGGAVGYLVKGMSLEDVRSRIEDLLARPRPEAEPAVPATEDRPSAGPPPESLSIHQRRDAGRPPE